MRCRWKSSCVWSEEKNVPTLVKVYSVHTYAYVTFVFFNFFSQKFNVCCILCLQFKLRKINCSRCIKCFLTVCDRILLRSQFDQCYASKNVFDMKCEVNQKPFIICMEQTARVGRSRRGRAFLRYQSEWLQVKYCLWKSQLWCMHLKKKNFSGIFMCLNEVENKWRKTVKL